MDGDEEMTRGEGVQERREGARGHSEVLLNKVEPMVLKVDFNSTSSLSCG